MKTEQLNIVEFLMLNRIDKQSEAILKAELKVMKAMIGKQNTGKRAA